MKEWPALHDAYARLAGELVATGRIPAGLTPVEQAEAMAAHAETPEAQRGDWKRLVELLDRCVYAGQSSEESVRSALLLCEQLRRAPGGTTKASSAAPARKRAWTRPFAAAFPVLAGVAALACVVVVLPKLALPGGGAKETAQDKSRAAWSGSLRRERDELAGHESRWSRPPARPTWKRHTIDPVSRAPTGTDGIRIDLNTGVDGEFVNAEDPFVPPLGWTHRERVATEIDSKYRLKYPEPDDEAAESAVVRVERTHRASVRVNLWPGRPVCIPSSSPDAVVTWSQASISPKLEFLRDSAGALWVSARHRGEVQIQYTLAAPTDYWTAPLPDVPFEPEGARLPSGVRGDAEEVLRHVGGVDCASFRDAVRRLQAYCSGFVVAPIVASDRRPNDFLTLAFARKGVCRHRALVFFVLANASGIRTRFVENKVHAFCEVLLPGGAWRRIEFRLEDSEGPPGRRAPGVGLEPTSRRSFWMAGSLLLLVLGLTALVTLSARHDRERHVVRRRSGGLEWEERAARDSGGNVGREARSLAALLVRAAAAAPGDLPPAVADQSRRLEAFASKPPARPEALTLQQVTWDCKAILRWLRGSRPGGSA